jgi:hypothetical protein
VFVCTCFCGWGGQVLDESFNTVPCPDSLESILRECHPCPLLPPFPTPKLLSQVVKPALDHVLSNELPSGPIDMLAHKGGSAGLHECHGECCIFKGCPHSRRARFVVDEAVKVEAIPDPDDGTDLSMFRERLVLSESESLHNQPKVAAKAFDQSWIHVLRIGEHVVLKDWFGTDGFDKGIAEGK